MAQNKQKKVDKKSNNISGRNIYLDRQGQTVYYDPISKCGYIIDKKVEGKFFVYKNRFVLILMIMILFTGNCYARAGGGSGSGSSGGSGGSSSGGGTTHYYYHDHGYGGGTSLTPQNSILLTATLAGTFFVARCLYRRYKAIDMHHQVKKQLKVLDDQDEFWNELRIKKEVKEAYYTIQKAWTLQDMETLKEYLTDNMYGVFETKINWNEFQGKRNVLNDIQLLKHDVVSLYDSINDDEDYFWVYIEGKMVDEMRDQENQLLESYRGVFVEYWKFKRAGNRILLDEIKQKDEYEI